MAYVITEPCMDALHKSCIQECPVDCIYEGDGIMVIHPDECIDCGACEPACPVNAIYYAGQVPEEWRSYIQASADFAVGIGSPGGAGNLDSRQA